MLYVSLFSEQDLGKYSCKAKNSLGSTDGEIMLYGELGGGWRYALVIHRGGDVFIENST